MFGTFPTFGDPDRLNTVVFRVLLIVVILLLWGMAESVIMLWYRARLQNRKESNGYVVVTVIVGFMILGLLQIFRARVSQEIFLLLLAVLSTHGMSRSGWEQSRPRIAFASSFASSVLLGSLSFLSFRETLPWQGFVLGMSVGSMVTMVESTWYGQDSLVDAISRWEVPAIRFCLFLGPIIVATIALTGYLPACFIFVYGSLPFAARAAKKIQTRGFVSKADFWTTAGVYASFIGIIVACRAHEHGWLI